MRLVLMMQSLSGLLLAAGFLTAAQAVPVLQIYIDGAIWDEQSEDWVTTATEFDLWVLGNTSQQGTILGVHLTAAYQSFGSGTIAVNEIGEGSAVWDPYGPDTGAWSGVQVARVDGARPIRQDGKALARHGIYGPGVMFDQWLLGDFAAGDDPIGDFGGGLPASYPAHGQINRYRISLTGPMPGGVHFDAFGHLEGSGKSVFAPFSHDASAAAVPEPATIFLVGLALIGVGGVAVFRRR